MILRQLKSMFVRDDGRKCQVLSLYPSHAQEVDFAGVLEHVLRWAVQAGLPEPYWMEIEAKGMRGGNTRFATGYKKLLTVADRRDVKAVWFNHPLEGMDDRFVGWSWAGSLARDCGIHVFMEANVETKGFSKLRKLVPELLKVVPLVYCYATEIPFSYGPYFWVRGVGFGAQDNPMSAKDKEELSKWAHAFIACEKAGTAIGANYLRDVYEINYLTAAHLDLQLDGKPLLAWISGQTSRGELQPVDDGLHCWTIPSPVLKVVRKALGEAQLLVCYGDYSVRSGGPVGHNYPY